MKHLNKVLFVFLTVCITLAWLLRYDGSVLTVYAAGGSPSTTKLVTIHNIKAKDKYYDGTNAAEFDTSNAVINGVLAGDDVTLSGVTGSFENKDSRGDKKVTVSGFTLGGDDAGKYAVSIEGSETSLTAAIKPKQVKVDGIEAEDKEYDNTSDVVFVLDKAVIEGLYEGDDLVLLVSGAFRTNEAGKDIEVEISSITFGGSESHNYEVANNSQSTTTADITPKPIVCEWVSDTGMVYNGKIQLPEFKIDSASLVPGDSCTAEVTSAEDGGGINAGEHTAKAELSNGNYQIPSGKETHKYSIARSSIELSLEIEDWAYGETPADPVLSGNDGNGDVDYEYKVKGADDSTYTGTVPTEPGSYTVRATVAETDNYSGSAAEADFTIITKTWTVSFKANGGSGTMKSVTVGNKDTYELPECSFKAPDETKEFKAWEISGTEYAAGDKITIESDTAVKALWKDKATATPTASPADANKKGYSEGTTAPNTGDKTTVFYWVVIMLGAACAAGVAGIAVTLKKRRKQ